MIELIPAIDIIGGKCVRLTKGDYSTKKEYGDPVSMAKEFEQLGYKRLHVVDLDGAKSKHVVNDATLRAITQATKLTVDFGGGVKTEDDLKKAYEAGATLVTAGSIAITNPELYLEWLQKYGADHLILGADVRNGKVSINGWLEDSDVELADFLTRYMNLGVDRVEAGEGFVEDEELRLMEYGGDELYFLGHALGEFFDFLVPPGLDAEADEPFLEFGRGFRGGHALEAAQVDGLFADLHFLEEAAFFGKVADGADVFVGDDFAVQDDFSGGGDGDPVDDTDERGLAGAVRAEQAEDFAFGHVDRDVVKRLEFPEGFGNVLTL